MHVLTCTGIIFGCTGLIIYIVFLKWVRMFCFLFLALSSAVDFGFVDIWHLTFHQADISVAESDAVNAPKLSSSRGTLVAWDVKRPGICLSNIDKWRQLAFFTYFYAYAC